MSGIAKRLEEISRKRHKKHKGNRILRFVLFVPLWLIFFLDLREQMPEFRLFRLEVFLRSVGRRDFDRNALDDPNAGALERFELLRIIRHQPDTRDSQNGAALRRTARSFDDRLQSPDGDWLRRCRGRSPEARRPAACSSIRCRGLPEAGKSECRFRAPKSLSSAKWS